MFVCLSARMSHKPHVQIARNFLYMLPMSVARLTSDDSTSGFVDDVTFSHKGPQASNHWENASTRNIFCLLCLVEFAR